MKVKTSGLAGGLDCSAPQGANPAGVLCRARRSARRQPSGFHAVRKYVQRPQTKAPVILTERSEWKDLGTKLTANVTTNAKIPRLAGARSGRHMGDTVRMPRAFRKPLVRQGAPYEKRVHGAFLRTVTETGRF